MSVKVNILGTVDVSTCSEPESVNSIIEELAVAGVNGISFSLHTDSSSSIRPFTIAQWSGIKNYCDALNIEFIGGPRAMCAVDCFEEIGVSRYRVDTDEVGNYLLLEKLARTGKELIISAPSGMDWQIEKMVDFIQPYNNSMIIMHWMPAYPCQPWDWGLRRLEWLKDHYGYKVGLCDRSGDLFASSAAIALGAEYLEIRYDDYTHEFRKRLIEGIRKVESSMQKVNSNTNEDNYTHIHLKSSSDRSLIFNKDKKKDSVITIEDIEFAENTSGIDVSRYYDIVGKSLCADVKQGELLNWSLLKMEARL